MFHIIEKWNLFDNCISFLSQHHFFKRIIIWIIPYIVLHLRRKKNQNPMLLMISLLCARILIWYYFNVTDLSVLFSLRSSRNLYLFFYTFIPTIFSLYLIHVSVSLPSRSLIVHIAGWCKLLPLVLIIRHSLEGIDGPFYNAFRIPMKQLIFFPLVALIKYSLFVYFIDSGA